jgi:hypothetical protein
MTRKGFFTLLGALLIAAPTWAADPADKCEATKVKETGKYAFCRLKALSKAILKGASPDYSKCVSKFAPGWQKAETKAGGACPTNADQGAMEAKIISSTDELAALLSSATGGSFKQVSVGDSVTCGLRGSGSVDCWEHDSGDFLASAPGGPFTQVSVGNLIACGLTGSGSVDCWDPDSGTFFATAPGGPFTQVSMGDLFIACGLTGSGSVDCWDPEFGTFLSTFP